MLVKYTEIKLSISSTSQPQLTSANCKIDSKSIGIFTNFRKNLHACSLITRSIVGSASIWAICLNSGKHYEQASWAAGQFKLMLHSCSSNSIWRVWHFSFGVVFTRLMNWAASKCWVLVVVARWDLLEAKMSFFFFLRRLTARSSRWRRGSWVYIV